MHAKPCFYCIILLTTLFISSCYWQPFPLDTPLSTPWSEDISTFADALNATLSPKDPLPHPIVIRAADRCWCDLTSGAFFEPFNVSHWEYLSVQRLKDSLQKRQKASDDLLRELVEPRSAFERDLHLRGSETSVSHKIWSVMKDLSPGFYNSFSNYMFHSEMAPEGVSSDDVTLPSPSPPPSVSEVLGMNDTLVVAKASPSNLPLIRKEYDLRPYGFHMVLDFSWSR
ncbi:hypothetical protein P691DRAFT_799969 [Macrolepiota fuliginosa MF-IS2]|uniref:Uncharacterized protein n=1 Tax=Macrolepiota fuliginosa MF-IS2 TaxID=1400762 RepID=A0A9P6C7M3_9AGAR|nr:hypothetical protein P691DRAFT_799969 [Macrolepiota fuliginosa MF-IS2]